jgi:hypothetical protein
LQKRVEVIQANLSHRPDIGVIIVGNADCIAIVAKLKYYEEVLVDRVLFKGGQNISIHDEYVVNNINPE